MADRTKWNPCATSALTAPKLNTTMNSNLLRVLLLESLQRLLRLLMIRVLNLKLCIKLCCLRLKLRYLTL